jgi:hypothetical protein
MCGVRNALQQPGFDARLPGGARLLSRGHDAVGGRKLGNGQLTVSKLRRSACGLLAALGSVYLSACAGVPREVHEPRSYPEAKLSASAITLEVVDSRPAPNSPSVRQLLLPGDFEATAQGRLTQMLSGQGPALDVVAFVSGGGAHDIVDARGEMTRISVQLDFEVKVKDGTVLRRAQTQSSSDLPRDEATPEEVNLVLRSTSLDAFDRYWADAKTTASLNEDLGAYAAAAGKKATAP